MFLSAQIFTLHWKRKGFLCVGVCLITVKQDCAACICEGVLKTVANSNADLDMAQKIQRERMFVQEKRIWMNKNIRRDSHRQLQTCSHKNLAKPKEIVMKKKSGNPDSTNNSLAHPEETLDNETLQTTTCSNNYSRGQAKVQKELMCAHIEHV